MNCRICDKDIGIKEDAIKHIFDSHKSMVLAMLKEKGVIDV